MTLEHKDARSLDHRTLEEMRRLAVRRVLAGESQGEVARSLAVHHHTVWKWMRTYRKKGADALARKTGAGRRPILSAKQQARLFRLIVGHTPEQLKFPFALWSLPVVQQLIEREFGLALHKSTVARTLHRLGLTPQKPSRRAFQRDDAACERWAKEEFPAIVRQARRRQATLLFEDEAGVHEDGPIAHTWGAKGQRPVVRVTGQRRKVNVISAISPRGRLWFRCFKGNLTATRFEEFLRDLLRDIRGPIELVFDKHPAHVAASTRRFILEHRNRLRAHYLPSYAPDMNPDEHVWSHLKRLFRSKPLAEGEDLDGAVHESMKAISYDRSLVRTFFDHPEAEYVRRALKW
jgi:transposase